MSNLTEFTPPLAWVWSQYYAANAEPPAAWVWSQYNGIVGAEDSPVAVGDAEHPAPGRTTGAPAAQTSAPADSRTSGLVATALLLIVIGILWFVSS